MHSAQDKIVLVTGAANGIGACIVKNFLDEGAKHIAALDIDVNQGVLLKKELNGKYGRNKVKYYECDVTTDKLEAVYDAVIAEFGNIDVVINCAGIMNDSPDTYIRQIDVNVTAMIRSTLKAFHHMRKDHGGSGGSILNIASLVALINLPPMPIYSATKSAVLQFSTSLGMEPRHSNTRVRILTVCFGLTDTDMVRAADANGIDKETDAAIVSALKTFPIQTKESAAAGLMDAFKNGSSASTWMVTLGKPAQDITENVSKGFEIMSRTFV